MNDASFTIHLNQTCKILKNLGLFKDGIYKPNKLRAATKRNIIDFETYRSYHDDVLMKRDYDILLKDDSYFQFTKKGDSYKYVFMQTPLKKISIEVFADICGMDMHTDIDEIESVYEESDDSVLYEKTENPIYLRYENSLKGYNPNVHSFSHLHIGLNKDVRIPLSIILTPDIFVLFAIKLAYKDIWETSLIEGKIKIENLAEKKLCEAVNKEYWEENEKLDLYLK